MRSSFIRIIVGGLAVGVAYCITTISSSRFAKAEDQISADAEKAHSLTAKELDTIYKDKTWPWDDGAAYFRAPNHAFTAWGGEGDKATYAEGTWSANDTGHLCFKATWYSRQGKGPSTICFEHRSDAKNIYQRKLPDGQWYIFSHLPALPDDAVQKLQSGDHVSEKYEANRHYLAEHKDQGGGAANGQPLTGKELDSIYQDRTWHWDDGAAYFRAAKRVFMASVGKGAEATYAEGEWSVNDQGRLCFSATWHSRQGKGPSTICFEHRKDDKNIYQRRLPHGQWYVFSHLPALPTDAIQKLEPGDHVSESYQKNRRYVAEHSRRRKRR
jgi:hypothetical protein